MDRINNRDNPGVNVEKALFSRMDRANEPPDEETRRGILAQLAQGTGRFFSGDMIGVRCPVGLCIVEELRHDPLIRVFTWMPDSSLETVKFWLTLAAVRDVLEAVRWLPILPIVEAVQGGRRP